MALDGEILRVRGDLEVGGAGHHVREGAEMAIVLPSPCAKSGCHNGADMFSLKTREDFAKRKPRPLKALQLGSMPEDNPDFKDSEEGKKLIQWLLGDQAE